MSRASAHGLTPEPDRGWLKAAACRGKGDVMFPENVVSELDRARRICAPCPVREECLAEALAMEGGATAKGRYGIRAGLTGGQRRALYEALRKKQARQQSKAAA
jgi:WhiB family redox-sensing transcriptional regulator